MPKIFEVYKCEACGNTVEFVFAGVSPLICCGKPMIQLKENTVDASKEKHVPVVEKTATGIHVKIGSVPHPMEEKHYIAWIEVIDKNKSYKHFLKPGDKPEEVFPVKEKGIIVREYCNIHGLWKTEA